VPASHREHAPHGDVYERHRPEQTVLHRIVTAFWPSFREQVEAIGSLPKFVVREVEEYLRCGILEYGFIRVECPSCGFERLVALSCKRRGFCPSCLGRRMSDSAVWLTEHVLPTVPIRQWVCTLPHGLRALVGYDRELCALVIDAFIRELLRSYRFRAKLLFGLQSVDEAFAGAVTVIQRFDSALRLNVHAHTLVLDGVYVRGADGETLRFLSLPAPTEDEVHNVADRTAKRVVAALQKRGRTLEALSNGNETEVDAALRACYDAAARTPKTRVVEPGRLRADERVAVVAGFNVHAGRAIDGRDRRQLERVCRYLLRPPIATERLTEAGDALQYELKRPWRNGTRFVTLEPHELLSRICAMVPPPRFHTVRFHGVLAPNANLREQVVASARPHVPSIELSPEPLQLPLFSELFEQQADASGTRRKPWAWLLGHVFAVDVTVCPRCSGPMKWRQVALEPDAIRVGLARAGLLARGPPKPRRVPLGQLSLPFPRMRRV